MVAKLGLLWYSLSKFGIGLVTLWTLQVVSERVAVFFGAVCLKVAGG